MAAGLVLYDLLYLSLAALLYGGALWSTWHTAASLSGNMISPFIFGPIAALAGLLILILEVAILTALCPRLKPGRYALMKSAVFYGWIFRSMLRRVLLLPSLKWILFNSNVLRWLSLRAMGARIAFTASISSDVDILDPSLTEIGAGSIVGARCGLSCHYLLPGLLVLDPIRIGQRAVLAADVAAGPGVTVGDGALVKPRSLLNIRARIGANAEVGPAAIIDALAEVGAGANVPTGALVAAKSIVPPRVAEAGEETS